jgi:hypothetical protein
MVDLLHTKDIDIDSLVCCSVVLRVKRIVAVVSRNL